MLHHGIVFIVASFLFGALNTNAQGISSLFKAHADLPSFKDDKLFLDIFYHNDSSFRGNLSIALYKFDASGDSLLMLGKISRNTLFKKGANRIKVIFTGSDSGTYYHEKFLEVIKRTGNMPPGSYKATIAVTSEIDTVQVAYLHEIDSLLKPNSPVTRDINNSLIPKQKSFAGIFVKNTVDKNIRSAHAASEIGHFRKKVDKNMRKRGLTTIHAERRGKRYIELYCDDWFAGMYEANKNQKKSAKNKLPNLGATDISNDLGSPSLCSQYKKDEQNKRENEDTKGEIGLNTNLSTGQEQNSGIDNNYYELRGRIETFVSGLPIEVEGLYTSQDRNRQIKSSYFRVHYNVDKMKEGLNKSLSSFNGKFAETKSKGVGMQQIYNSAINNLEMQKANLLTDIRRESGANKIGKGLPGKIEIETGEVDDKERQLENKRRQVEEMEKKITKYKTLLNQYENTNHFDSLLGYSKTKDAGDADNLSYKQLAKKGANLLPDGKAKSFITGITSLDAGMFSKDESSYTMSGQMVKGIDFGYDLGFCEAAVTVGKTEYVGRDGSLDRYTCYSERTTFKPAKNQKITAIYYGYTPDKKVFSDGFFKNAGISAPGFFQPVHIGSINYSGAVTKYITVGGEAAASFKNSDNTNSPKAKTKDRMAYNVHAEGSIPHTNLSLESSYDGTGRYFENNTLPVSFRGTEQFRIAAKNEFFKSLVIAGVDYNRMAQANFSGGGSITRWGFDVKTNFKRYPNLAVSYKPFTSIHSYTDTLNIPQRQLLGSVWTGKATYQIRQHEQSWRFMLLYNSCRTVMDTTRYGSTLLQAMVIYSDKTMTITGTIGRSAVTGIADSVMTMPASTTFFNLAVSYNLSKKFTLSATQDFGVAFFGLCRYAAGLGGTYRMEKIPLILRLNTRYNTYALNKGTSWKEIYSCNLDIVYRFKLKNEKNNF
jgi:hypothetical protein